MGRALALLALLVALTAGAFAQQPARDTPAQPKDAVRPPAGRITGRVVASDNGRPVKRARVFITAAELPGGRGMLTDDGGVFDFTELPAGRYTLTVSKTGFVSLSYGQRRPLQAGTPLQLADGEQLKGIQFQLPRGSVIGGRVLDEDGDAMPGVMVRVMRYQYQQGERRLTPAGNAQTDDKGQYRVWGLMPGDYYVNAVMRGREFRRGLRRTWRLRAGAAAAAAPRLRLRARNEQDQINYAPTYYPGVPSVNEAKAITVGLSQEVLDINFGMLLVRIARITGHVSNPDGTPVTSGNVNLLPETGRRAGQSDRHELRRPHPVGRRVHDHQRAAGALHPARAGRTMGRRRSSARSRSASTARTSPTSPSSCRRARRSAGCSRSCPAQSNPPDPTQFRISAPSTDQSDFGPQPNARVDKDGRFTLSGVSAGSHLIRAGGNSRGWILKSVTVGGRDVTDTPIQVRSGETVSNVVVVFTDRQNEINGTVTDEQGAPVPDFTVLAFPTDASLWRPQARQIMTARPDQTGKYRIRGLPPGEYYLVDRRSDRTGRVVRAGVPRRPSRRRRARDARRGRRQDAGLQGRSAGTSDQTRSYRISPQRTAAR